MRKSVLFAVFVLFPALAFAQITISPTQIAYNANAEATQPTLTITGTALAGNVDTLVEFTYSDGAFTDVFASTASSTTVTVLVPPSVFGLAGTAVVSSTVTAVDAVSGSLTPTCSPASGSTFPAGVTQVTCFATDTHDNVGFGSFFVSVNTPPGPTLSLPADFSVSTLNPSGTPVGWDATADQDAAVTCSPAVGSNFPVGTTTVTCSATGIFGTTSTGSFHVTVVLDARPIIHVPFDILVSAASS